MLKGPHLYISGKIAHGIGAILKARKYLMKDFLISLYYSFVYIHISFALILFGGLFGKHISTCFVFFVLEK